jgi:hypothetical protein
LAKLQLKEYIVLGFTVMESYHSLCFPEESISMKKYFPVFGTGFRKVFPPRTLAALSVMLRSTSIPKVRKG